MQYGVGIADQNNKSCPAAAPGLATIWQNRIYWQSGNWEIHQTIQPDSNRHRFLQDHEDGPGKAWCKSNH